MLAEAPPSADSRGALYGAVALVLTTTIGGAFAYLTARTKPASTEPTVVYRDPPTTHALPKEMADLFAAERDRLTKQIRHLEQLLDREAAQTQLWMQRAYEKGYKS